MPSSSSQLPRTVFVYLVLLLFTLGAIYPLSHFAISTPTSSDAATPFLPWLSELALIGCAVALTGVALASAIGYSLSRARSLRRSATLGGALLAQLLPGAILLAPICGALAWLGLIRAWFALLIVYFVTMLPLSIWQMKRNYDAIPIALEEAAEIEGASAWQSFFRIVFPLALPAMAITFLFSVLVAWNEDFLGSIFLRNDAIFVAPAQVKFFQSQAMTPALLLPTLLVSIPAVLAFLLLSRLLIFVSKACSSDG